MNELRELKGVWRRRLMKVRAAVSRPGERSASIRGRLLQFPAVSGAKTLFCFISHGDEVDTRGLIDALAAGGRQLLVPRIVDRSHMIAVAFEGWDKLVRGTLGIPTPPTEIPWAGPIDTVITPGLGFSAGGARLGFGRGYYDAWFATNPAPCRVGICFECQVAADLPAGDGDLPVDFVVTEDRLIATGARYPAGPPDRPPS